MTRLMAVRSRLGLVLMASALALEGAAALGQEPPPASNRKLSPNSPDEPVAKAYSAAKAAEFLDLASLSWTRQRKCMTCHTNINYMIARPALEDAKGPAPAEVRAYFEGRAEHWDDASPGSKPQWDAEVVATAVALACNDAATTGKLSPLARKALDRMWTLQRPDGSWDWLKCDLPPYEHDDDYGAAFAAVGVGLAPEGYRDGESARKGLEKLRAYFRDNPPTSLHHKAVRLWAATRLDGVMSPAQREATVKELLGLQRPDGGWNLASLGDWKRADGSPNVKDAPSDGFGTGFVVFVLRQTGLAADAEPIRRGVAWLKSHQRESGRWFTRSLTNDKAHYVTHAGTGFAILAIRACQGDD